ncbi:solute carrier family 52, riboflavin transporter, member 3-A [Lepisosteus oculatus]|nr:PREDICTED: solute carrier family 52, riboflavin transporter, member 3 [Lepisosteus oculatus]XP_015220079.1 PREDICTED: solute carrier family 52, riboflavin transporter, member 3 [Lepisosteus oculatus]XP_015220080.1 PREDICTED: solute carrier family 52, riboflavin transporter, member 3 [Lepisosteus oculatus]XP_015220081.1 PREDICTED: solute carrier family 52, riboflavin transporter, member 3 [Lepisosteus oculatus]XP_015220082.1 PREDICTED: solute carrier family 52, riboflavin transporter, member 
MAVLVHLLACAFGLGSWVAINGLWVELPLIVNELPEGWYLPSYLTVIIQLANVGPLLVSLIYKFSPGRLKEIAIIYIIVSVGTVSCFLLALFWKETSVVMGRLHSTAFLIITFFLSLVDCTSSVTFLPFMMQLPAKYVTTYFIGEGLSGFVPGLVALGQGVGIAKCVNVTKQQDNITEEGTLDVLHTLQPEYLPPTFSTEVFFFFLTAMMVVCLSAFVFLNRVSRTFELSTENLVTDSVVTISSGLDNRVMEATGEADPRPVNLGDPGENNEISPGTRSAMIKASHSVYEFAFIYFLVLWVNALTNGLLPSVQTYSCMPYGNMAYHLSATLGSMANPVACVIAMFLPRRSLVLLGVLCLAGTGFGAYNMAMAALSPCPLLQGTTVGVAVIILSWVLFAGTLSYVKVMVGVILRDESHSALVWCGVAVQTGSMVGALVMFPLVNVFYVFKAGDICNTKCSS